MLSDCGCSLWARSPRRHDIQNSGIIYHQLEQADGACGARSLAFRKSQRCKTKKMKEKNPSQQIFFFQK